jgi:hypothetical protein
MPATCRVFCYFVTFTISEEYIDYEAIYTAHISSAYGRLERSAVLSGSGCETHGTSVHFDSSLTELFEFHILERITVGDFLNLK